MLTSFQKRKLTKLFSMYDLGNNGVLKLSDFEEIARRLASLRGWKAGSPEERHLLEQYTYRWIRLRGDIKERSHRHKYAALKTQLQIVQLESSHPLVKK